MAKWVRSVGRWIGGEALHGLLGKAWPYIVVFAVWLVDMLTGLYPPGVPLPYLFTASVIAFAFTAWAMVQLSIMRERSRVKDKLYFTRVWLGRTIDSHTNEESGDQELYLTAVQFGIVMENAAHFPIYLRVDDIRSSFVEKTYSPPQYGSKTAVATVGRETTFRDAPIKTDGLLLTSSTAFEGYLSFTVSYDRSPRYRYKFTHNLKLSVLTGPIDPSKLEIHWTFLDTGTSNE